MRWNPDCGVRLLKAAVVVIPDCRRQSYQKERRPGINCARELQESTIREEQMRHGMNILRSEKHKIFGMHINKISISPFDSKR